MTQELNIGDKVALCSGGRSMTVSNTTVQGSTTVVWHDAEGRAASMVVPAACLKVNISRDVNPFLRVLPRC